jgi:tripartite-type tricarboxylate transporter receptor subunit TctC
MSRMSISKEEAMREETTLTRRSIIAGALTAPFAIPHVARAQAWPVDLVRIIIPTAAGGALDTIARMIHTQLQNRLGVNVVIENRTGASSTIGASAVAKAAPDGGTFLFAADSIIAGQLLLPNLGYDVQKDLVPVTMISDGAMILACNPSRPWKTFTDIVAAAKEKPQTISCATTGAGGTGHLSMAALSKRVGIELVHIPYRGGGPAVNDTVAGHADTIMSSAASLAPHIESGKLRALVQCSAKRAAFLPNVATAMESGVTDFTASSWYTMFAPGGTPDALVRRFHETLVAIISEKAMHDEIANKFRVDVPLYDTAQVRDIIAKQIVAWGEIIRENNIKPGGR